MVKLNHENRQEYTDYILQLLTDKNRSKFREYFLELHPTDQVEIFELLEEETRQLVYSYLTPDEMGDVFQGLEFENQKAYILEMDRAYAVEILNILPSDEAADFLGKLDDSTVKDFLGKMDKEEAQEVKELLAYPEETAGAIMTTEYVVTSVSEKVDSVMQRLRREGPNAETIYYLYVIDKNEKLVGVLSLRDLIIAQLEQQVEDIMSSQVVSVTVLTDQEEVANTIKNYDLLAVPVTDDQGRLVGIVTVDDVIDVLEDEATEDFGEISAVKGAVDLEIGALEASRKRLPWLVLLLFIGMFTARIIGSFEATLEEAAMLAFFIPLIAGMAGNTGIQSLAVVVRGLTLGKFDKDGVIHLIKRETLTGLIMGLVCGAIVALISQIITHGNLVIGFIIGVSLFCTLIVATLAGAIIPLIINRLKIDPAVASGPFITTINDILGLMIYFSIATALLQYL
ncbi:magnesium transporter [Desulfofalx alkaliphila]|uniref:magnesium transporter n=1 Tax=Desulfofalx alkaliphila TaxID=105483 RepID=UPI0004E1D291|nr:magnesium transporter [Desulfofalx alkaliphila]